jgi:hypothetical protein
LNIYNIDPKEIWIVIVYEKKKEIARNKYVFDCKPITFTEPFGFFFFFFIKMRRLREKVGVSLGKKFFQGFLD